MVQGRNIGKHIIFRLVLCFMSFIPFVICYGLTSADFKNAMTLLHSTNFFALMLRKEALGSRRIIFSHKEIYSVKAERRVY